MPQCLYCQRDNPPRETECGHCGMPLPALSEKNAERRQRRFMWFCIGLTVFCAVMIVWLPRSIA
nr:DnrP protein [uncultured Pseudomonas sp.]